MFLPLNHKVCFVLQWIHREPRLLASQKLLHQDNKKDSLSLSYFVDLRRILNNAIDRGKRDKGGNLFCVRSALY